MSFFTAESVLVVRLQKSSAVLRDLVFIDETKSAFAACVKLAFKNPDSWKERPSSDEEQHSRGGKEAGRTVK